MSSASAEYLKLTRETVRRFICPRCSAGPGESCARVNGQPRLSNHRERLAKAQRMIASQLEAADRASPVTDGIDAEPT